MTSDWPNVDQSPGCVGQIGKSDTFTQNVFSNWNFLFIDFELLFILLVIVQIWGRYFYQVIQNIFFSKNSRNKIYNIRNHKAALFLFGLAKLFEKLDEKEIEHFGKLKLLKFMEYWKFLKMEE